MSAEDVGIAIVLSVIVVTALPWAVRAIEWWLKQWSQ